jgi:isoleucyl-tRNA synthetase
LYCDPINSEKRNSCLKVLNIILDSLLKWFAPILSFTTEEIYRLLSTENKSIHLEKFVSYPKSFKNDHLEKKWNELIKIRDICNISIEEKRANKLIGSSLEAKIEVFLNYGLKEITNNIDFSELCITSRADLNFSEKKQIEVITKKAEGNKCPVCWKINTEPCVRHS